MEALAQQHSVYQQAFEQGREARAAEPAWLRQRRDDAMAAFERLGFPSRRVEAWRNANLNAFAQQRFLPADAPGAAPQPAIALADAQRIVFVDGRLSEAASDLSEPAQGVRVMSLAQALASEEALLEEHLARHLDNEQHAFAALNTAFMNDGLVIALEPGAQAERPLLLEFVVTRADVAAYPRILVVAGRGAELTVVEHHRGIGEGAYLNCPMAELVIGENAGVEWYKVQEEGAQAFHVGCLHAELARDARLNLHSFAAGGAFARTEVSVGLDGEGAEAVLNGLYLTADGQYTDHHTYVDHRAPHCTSRQRFKGVLDGKSEAVYDGLVRVAHGAQKTGAEQENRNLLLSRRALAHSNPRLEINTDDVKCSHGSTTGELDRDALFYLRSRGLGEADAQSLLTYAFAVEQLSPIRIEAVRDYQRRALFARLPGDDTLEETL